MLNRILFPTLCYFCRQSCVQDQRICDACVLSLPYLDIQTLCPHCGLLSAHSIICGTCLKTPRAFDRCIPLLSYTPEVAKWIARYKFHGQLLLATLFGDLFGAHLSDTYQDQPKPEVIIPIPLHRKRLWRRGFNQSIELGQGISKTLDIPLDTQTLFKTRAIPAQSSLDAKGRQRNIKNAFGVHSHGYQYVVLLDDVMTTGSTLNEAAKQLKKSGVRQVDVWCVARALK